MFAEVHNPTYLSPKDLDDYLEKGWFRAGKTIFTTNFLHFNDVLYSAIWLRIALNDFKFSKSQQNKIQTTRKFTFSIQPFELTNEKEQLYADYKTGISFSTASSLQQLLFDNQSVTAFNTYEVTVFEGKRLIGLGIFDLGKNTAAGIVSFSHPDYKKFSLGAVIILKKIAFVKEQGLDYFYPGYFAPDYPAFDYKLTLGKNLTEFYDSITERWLPISAFQKEYDLAKISLQQLSHAQAMLNKFGNQFELLIYDFFDLNLTQQFKGQQLFDTPLIIPFRQRGQYIVNVITYDLKTRTFKLLHCDVIYYLPNAVEKTGHYNKNILKVAETLVESSDVSEFILLIY